MEQFLALKASAGSGKTFNLSLRFIYLLFCGANPYQILTLTFTKKASNEMHHRIYEFLKALKKAVDSGQEEQSDIFKALVAKGLGKELIRENIARIYAEFMRSNPRITTIDAFFHFVLKKFCWYVGVSSGFEVGNTPLELINERFLTSLSPAQCQNLARFCFSQGMKLSEFLSLLQRLSLLPKELLEGSRYLQEQVGEGEIEARVNAKLREIYEYLASLPKEYKGALKFFGGQSFRSIVGGKISVNKIVKWQQDGDLKNINLAPMDSVRDEICGLFRLYYLQKQGRIFDELQGYMSLFAHAKAQVLRSHNTLGFDEVMMKNYELLGENLDREFFYFRLDERISHILLDEFQDTSVMQFQILKPMIDEICAGEGRIGDRSFFVVGDEKQGIYGFRGSFGGVFEAATKPLAQESLAYNYRSSQRVVAFNNAFFAPLYAKIGYKNQQLPESSKPNAGYVRLLPQVGGENGEWQEALKKSVYDELEAILSAGAREDDVAILVFKNNEAVELREYLIAHNPRLNVITEASASLFEKKEAKILENALRYILLREQYEALKQARASERGGESEREIARLTSAMRLCQKRILKLLGKEYGQLHGAETRGSMAQRAQAQDEEAQLQECLNTLAHGSKSPSEVVLGLLEALCLGSSVGLKFLELSCAYTHMSEFLEALPQLVCNAPAQSNRGVKIMTIHKSKGLEFEHVILCDKLGGDKSDSEKIIYGYEGAAMREIYYKLKGRENFDDDYAAAKEARQKRNDDERLNVLYVAFTRAKYGLSVARRETKSRSNSAFEGLGLDKLEQLDEIGCRTGLDSEKSVKVPQPQLVLENMRSFGRQSDFVREEREEPQDREALTRQMWQNIIFGNALHSVFELHLGYGVGRDGLLHILRNRYGFALSEKSLGEVLGFGLECVGDEQFSALVAGKKCACEVSYISQERLYRMDTLLYDEGEYIVLDYKSGAHDRAAQEAQVREYMRFLREVDSKRHTKGFIIYPLNPRGKRVCEVRE